MRVNMKALLISCFFILCTSMACADDMTQDEMEKIVIDNVNVIKHKKGNVLFSYKGIEIALISDIKYNRMRLISPITSYSSLSSDALESIMKSNFHLALDARYAVSGEVVYSAFIHPLSSLTKKELLSALNQVATLARTFGTTYTSGELVFKGSGKNKIKNKNKKHNETNIIKNSI